MTNRKWCQLADIADAKFQAEAQKMRALQSEVDVLGSRKQALASMSEQAKDAFRDIHPAHYQSGDVQWQSWVNRNKVRLNIEEARLRALREIQLPSLRQAFARKRACEEIAKSLKKKRSGYS